MSAPSLEQIKRHAAKLAGRAKLPSIDSKALHVYRDEQGDPLYWRIRLKCNSTGEKYIRPFCWNGSAFENTEPPAPPEGKPLYGLERLSASPDAQVIITEGESCADALNKAFAKWPAAGLIAMTSGGAQSAGAADWKPLAGRSAIIWPDNDEPGPQYAADVVKCLQGIAASVAVLNITPLNLPHQGDAVDWLQSGGNLDGLQALIDSSRPPEAIGSDSRGSGDGGNTWLEPEPLRATLPPAEPYPVDALGDVLGGAAKAIHESVKAPLALCCQSVLAAASLAAQAHYDVLLPWGERKPLSLFLLTVGESGERKSGVDDLVLGAAKVQERADMEVYAEDQKQYLAELASWTQATDAARKAVTSGKKGNATAREVQDAVERCGKKPEVPIVPLRFMSDPTVEGMYKQLAVGQPSVALFSDEGGLLIGGHALNSDNALKTMARWCKLWDGSPFDRVRAGDGAGVLYGRRMAFHQLAQPDVMATLLSDRMANGQGLLARCLVAWPDSTIGTRHIERYEWAGDRHELKRLFAVFKGLMEAEPPSGKSPQELDPFALPLSEDAKNLAVAANNQFETLMARGADLAELRDRTSKAVENACRIAGVLAVIEGGLSAKEIGKNHLERGLMLVQWYLAETLRIRGAAAIPQSVLDAEMLSAWLHARDMKQFRSKQILKSGPNQLRNKTRLLLRPHEVSSGSIFDPGVLKVAHHPPG